MPEPLRRCNSEPPIWTFEPRAGSVHCAAVVAPEEFEAITTRGYVRIDGQIARPVSEDSDRALGFLRLVFDNPYERAEATDRHVAREGVFT
jgi:hypothetical protein